LCFCCPLTSLNVNWSCCVVTCKFLLFTKKKLNNNLSQFCSLITLSYLCNLVSQLPLTPDVICLSESRINQPMVNTHLPGYIFHNTTPQCSRAGGAAIYISKHLNFKQVDSPNLHTTESLWLKIVHKDQSKTFLIGTIYHHPRKTKINSLTIFTIILKN